MRNFACCASRLNPGDEHLFETVGPSDLPLAVPVMDGNGAVRVQEESEHSSDEMDPVAQLERPCLGGAGRLVAKGVLHAVFA